MNAEHRAYESTQAAALEHAIAAGDALIEAKARLPHGEWLPWLREHAEFGERTARHYMAIARNRKRVADLGSVRAAVAELAEPKPKPVKTDLWSRWLRLVGEIPPPNPQRYWQDRRRQITRYRWAFAQAADDPWPEAIEAEIAVMEKEIAALRRLAEAREIRTRSIDRVVAALRERGCEPRANPGHGPLPGWDARCPVPSHDNPGLGLRVNYRDGGDRGWLIRLACHAGCDSEAVRDALGLSVRDLFDEPTEAES
jgi:hypothetical protein